MHFNALNQMMSVFTRHLSATDGLEYATAGLQRFMQGVETRKVDKMDANRAVVTEQSRLEAIIEF